MNGEPVTLDEYIEYQLSETIHEGQGVPAAELHHLVLGQHVDQASPSLLVFATHGTTISQQVLGDEAIPSRKYLGLVDSPYLSELTSTNKAELAEFDSSFQALRAEAASRSKNFIEARQGDRVQEFLKRARANPSYPYKSPPRTPIESYRRQLYDGILLTLEETYRISGAPAHQLQLILGMTRQLLHSEDLAAVLTNVLGLKGEEVARFAGLLRTTSLSSVIAVADLLVDRLRFLDELNVLIYGLPARYVKERSQLHKIIELHTWLFGEQFNLMGSDRRLDTLLAEIRTRFKEDDELQDGDIPELKDIPDLYLTREKWLEGSRSTHHLIVEMKRPSVKLLPKHVDQLRRYAREIVEHPMWNQRRESHSFTFVLVSAAVGEEITTMMYIEKEEPGLLARPPLSHPTELWAFQWSDYFENRREELRYLEKELEITHEPELLEYLKEKVGEFLPLEVANENLASEGNDSLHI